MVLVGERDSGHESGTTHRAGNDCSTELDDDLGQRRALRRTLGPLPAGRRETPPQREALPHKDAILNTPGPMAHQLPSSPECRHNPQAWPIVSMQ
jgi:hypothetical protein